MEAAMSFAEELFTLDAYWKILVIIWLLGTVLAWGMTLALKEAQNRYYKSRKPPAERPWWRWITLQVSAILWGAGFGVGLDLSVLPIEATETTAAVPSYWFVSLAVGLASGILCTYSIHVIKWVVSKKAPTLADKIELSSAGARFTDTIDTEGKK